jgi:C-terminal processing protease CtpA/Prc
LPIATDGSGLRWETDSTLTRIFVSHIIENSAAADEPIEAGDELLELNEKPVAELTLSDIKKALKQHGEQVSMKFQRNGYHTYEVGLELRSLWPAD